MPEDRSVLERAARPPDRTRAYGAGPDRVIDLYDRPASAPALAPVVLVHGGYWRPEYDRTHLRPMAAALAERGHPVSLLEYTRSPGDPDATVADVRAGIAAAADELDGPALVVGHSAGGHLALLEARAMPEQVGGCLALAPLCDLAAADEQDLDDGAVRAFLGGPAADRPDLDPAVGPAPTVPTTVMQGDADALVPPAMAIDYAGRHRLRLVVLPDTGHFAVIDPASAAWSTVIAELDALAAAAGGQWPA